MGLFGQVQTESPHGPLTQSCNSCHTAAGWNVTATEMTFKHQSTGFELRLQHASLDCRDCHQDLVFENVANQCADCHTDLHKGELGNDCATCHDTKGWDNRIPMLEAHQNTLFPLIGNHSRVECEACHVNQQRNEFSLTPTDCAGCHLQEFNNTVDPNHVSAGFDLNCETCHLLTDPDWERASFDHPISFPLTGGHALDQCSDCHQEQFQGTPTDCIACHENDYNGVADPNHLMAGFPHGLYGLPHHRRMGTRHFRPQPDTIPSQRRSSSSGLRLPVTIRVLPALLPTALPAIRPISAGLPTPTT